MNELRWDPYAFIQNEDINSFFENHFCNDRSVLFILGKGFDVRMNSVLEVFLRTVRNVKFKCLLIEYHEGDDTPSMKYANLVTENIDILKKLLARNDQSLYESLLIDIWRGEGQERKRVGDRDVSKKIYNYDITGYDDIIVDISSLPRGIYFSLVATLLKKIDTNKSLGDKNLFITVAENNEIDKVINEIGIEERIKCIHGFSGGIEQEARKQKPLVFFPVLGEKKVNNLNKLYTHLNPQEICPILPFPSKDPRRSDSLFIDYHKTLFDELRVESQNIMYVPEQNPFEMYRILMVAINNYNESLEVLGNCNVAVTVFSSKLLTIGVLLAAYEMGLGIGVYNLDAQGYNIDLDDMNSLRGLNKNNEFFLMWLNGEAYEE